MTTAHNTSFPTLTANAFNAHVASLSRRSGGNWHDAEDAVADAFLALLQRPAAQEVTGGLIAVTAHRAMVDAKRSRNGRNGIRRYQSIDATNADGERTGIELSARETEGDDVAELLALLGDDAREYLATSPETNVGRIKRCRLLARMKEKHATA